MPQAYICDAVRTPIGRYAGGLSAVRTDDLAATPIVELMKRNPSVDWGAVNDVMYGCTNQAGEDNRNVARMAGLLAGLPPEVPGVTFNRLCGSGMDAVGSAARAIRVGEAELIVAGGVESMSRAPYVMSKGAAPFDRGVEMHDSTIGWRFVNRWMKERYGVESMASTAENVADQFRISREDQDLFALRSQKKTAAAVATGLFREEIVPVVLPKKKGEDVAVEADEHPRPDTTLEGLARLKPIVRPDGTVTAGNASGVNDGACALLIASEGAAKRNGLTPRARIVAMAVAGVAPRVMGIGPIPATRKVLALAGPRAVPNGRDRAERGVLGAVARRSAGTGVAGRRAPRQPERRCDRPRAPPGDERRAARDDGNVPAPADEGASTPSAPCASGWVRGSR